MRLKSLPAAVGLLAVCNVASAQTARETDETIERDIVLLVVQAEHPGERLLFSEHSTSVGARVSIGGGGGCSVENSDPSYVTAPTAEIRAMVKSATQDFCLRNTQRTTFPPRTVAAGQSALAARRVRVAPAAPGWVRERCSASPRMEVSRAGFDSKRSVAIVRYRVTVGLGPYPGCGYIIEGGHIFARQRDGRWKHIAQLAGMMT